MKKGFFSFLILFLFLFSVGVSAVGEETPENTDAGSPKLIVTAYSLSTGKLKASETAVLSVTVKNVSKTVDAESIVLSFSCDKAFVDGVSDKYIEKIAKGKSVTETFKLKAAPDAESGLISATVSGEYESKSGQSFSFSSNITLETEKKAAAVKTETDSSPKLMVTAYQTEKGYLSPEGKTTLSVTVSNMSKTAAVRNIKLTLSDESGEIRPEGLGTAYIETLTAGKSYEWKQNIVVSNTAAVGTHRLTVTAEYEDKNGASFSASDTLNVDVRQIAKLDFDGAKLSVKSYQGETQSVTLNLMNTGKSTLYNCKIDFAVKGLDSGGSVFVGEIAPGENKSGTGNLRVSQDLLGKTEGEIIITCEDSFGESYEKTAKVSTVIEKKPEKTEDEETGEKKKNNLWWLFLLIGVLVGGSSGFGVMWYIGDKKQRKEDDLRL